MAVPVTTLFDAHKETLEAALTAIRTRAYWSAYSDNPKSYGETAPGEGQADFEALLGKPFPLSQKGKQIGTEVSCYGRNIDITYPEMDAEALLARAEEAFSEWASASVETRIGIGLEILSRLNKASFLIAHATHHTTGQAFAMAFQAGGPHAQDRGLEAIAYAYEEMARVPGKVLWEKPVGRNTIRLQKNFQIVPRGIGLVIGCWTFPTWNSYPALFANLVTGNAAILKPHPKAILPLAITARIGREVLAEQGFNPDVLQLAADTPHTPIAKPLAQDSRVQIIDFTGSPAFGQWLRESIQNKAVHTEEAGVNTIVIDSTSTFQAMCDNIAFSLSLYSGQMCTAPKVIFIPRSGILTDQGQKSFHDVAAGITGAIDKLLSDSARAEAVLGAIPDPLTLARVFSARDLGRILRDSEALKVAARRTATPLVLEVDANDEVTYFEERFGPISFIVAVKDADDGITRATRAANEKGAITASLYSTDSTLADKAARAYARAGVALSINLVGGIYVNQSAAFSDYHVSGVNPAGNACLVDPAFVARRFHVGAVRQPSAA